MKKAKIYERLSANYAIKLLAVAVIIGVIIKVFSSNIFVQIDSQEDGLMLVFGLVITKLVIDVALVVGILKVLLTLKPATHVQ